MGIIIELLKDPAQVDAVTKSAFEQVDADNSGFVDEVELGMLMKKVAEDCNVDAPSKEDVTKALKAIDANHDGKISLEEFKVLVIEILKALAAAEKEAEKEEKEQEGK